MQIVNLSKRQDLNGQIGVCQGASKNNGRVTVVLKSGETIAINEDNLLDLGVDEEAGKGTGS